MLFAVYFALRRQWVPAFAATILATIGQADMLNTFCHLHTPIFYSLLRSIHAVWLGILIGGIALWIYHTLTAPRAFTSFKPTRIATTEEVDDEPEDAVVKSGAGSGSKTPVIGKSNKDRFKARPPSA